MPSQVRIISPRNSAEWDRLVQSVVASGQLRQEHTYGGCGSEERADKVRRAIRTAAKHLGHAAKVYWNECDSPGSCAFGDDCTHHVKFSIFSLDEGRAHMASRSQQQQRGRR
ncbi:MAG: hypothetical protein ACYCO9_16345 [Streptosporangiaceae bacterium]